MFREVVQLVKCGVPYPDALRMSRVRRVAWLIAHGELDGQTFDWGAMSWQ